MISSNLKDLIEYHEEATGIPFQKQPLYLIEVHNWSPELLSTFDYGYTFYTTDYFEALNMAKILTFYYSQIWKPLIISVDITRYDVDYLKFRNNSVRDYNVKFDFIINDHKVIDTFKSQPVIGNNPSATMLELDCIY